MKSSAPNVSELGPLQMLVLGLTVIVLGILAAETFLTLPVEVARIFRIVDNLVCVVFLADFVIRFRRAPSKLAFMKWGWIDLLASVPEIDALRLGRVFRLFRLLRLLRALRSLREILHVLFASRAKGGAVSVGFVAFVIVAGASAGILLVEKDPASNIRTAEDALWWSMTTVTTVGYGDRYPVTTAGRAIAVTLMVCGMGLFGTLSGVIAGVMLGGGRREGPEAPSGNAALATEIAALRKEVAALGAARGDGREGKAETGG